MIGAWWFWVAFALVLGILEVIVPSQIFLGFALGAVATGLALVTPLSDRIAGSLPVLLVIFAVCSTLSWLVLRIVLGVRKDQVKTFDHDINDN